jgi:hypothetical protein
MANYVHLVIVVVTITVLSTLVIFPTNAFAQNGDLYIHIRGASLGDNLKVSANTDQYSWEWRDTFIFAEHFYKRVSGVFPGDEINVCLENFNTGTEDCDSGTFNNNLSADVFVNID